MGTQLERRGWPGTGALHAGVRVWRPADKCPHNSWVLPWTIRESKHSLVLSSKCNQILHWWVGTSLCYCPQKLSSLRESNSIVAILQLWIIRHHLAHFAHLPVGVSEEPALCINNDVTANHDPVNIDTLNIVLQDRLNASHPCSTVSHTMPENHRYRCCLISL